MVKSADRRVRRTKGLLHQALIELLLEKGYTRTTVQDILDRADIGRSTFYSHYRDKDDLLVVSCTEYLRAAVHKPGADDARLWEPVQTMLRLAEQHRELYRALVGRRSSGVLLRATQQMVEEILAENLRGRLDIDDDEIDTTLTFLSWALVGVLGSIAEDSVSASDAFSTFERRLGHGLSARRSISAPE
ncbi:TetR family transcriptional regulator [Rhodococcus opacus]|nr:TetR family transcriptional regulator [Rhodococcus opacus]MDT2006848.1 TetR family transcriptional regulator [Rhodococcus opacus]